MIVTIEFELFAMLFALIIFFVVIGSYLKENDDFLLLPFSITIALIVYFCFYGIFCIMR